MEQLAALLGDISPQEREEALDYYERYFDEAGDDLQQAIDHLGSPQKVAQDIKSGLILYRKRCRKCSIRYRKQDTGFLCGGGKERRQSKSICCKVVILELVGRSEHDHEGDLVCTGTGDSDPGCRSRSWNSNRSAWRTDRDRGWHIRTDHWDSGRSTWHYDRGLYIWSSQYCLRSRDAVCKPISRSDVPRPWMYRPCRWDFYDISVHMALSENASGSDPDGRKSTS